MVLRRTWPQRLIAVGCLAVIVGAVLVADLAEHVEEVWREVDRVVIVDEGQYGRQLLRTDTEPGEPVNFLIVGTDSALGLDPDDPVMSGRVVDPTGRSLADTIMLVRLDPVSGSAWVLSIPRDLWAEIPGAQDNRITSALYIGGAEMLVATVTSIFDVEINHYVEVNLAGFREVVDTLGGVPVWFDNPVRDPRLAFSIAEPGCHVLDGEQALHYVRSRRYTELIDGRWRITGGDDFTRIERQQDFLVLALDRAINRGARNPSTMVELLDAASASLTLDQDLTLAELISLGDAFADFNPENLLRQRLEVYTVWHPDGTYKGEAAYKGANAPLLEVFRGAADSVKPAEVSLTIAGSYDVFRDDAVDRLTGEGFDVVGSVASPDIPETVVLHGPGDSIEAMTVAQYLDPVPYVVEDDRVDGVVAVLGSDYGGIKYVFQPPMTEVRAQVQARGLPPLLPDPDAGFAPVATVDGAALAPAAAATVAAAALAPAGAGGVGSPLPALATAGGGLVVLAAQSPDPDTGPPVIQGRPPEGESCS